MSKNKPPKTGTCVYCGKAGNLTNDHIPPKNLFAKPRPNNLVVVPSCYSCNSNESADDEYLRLMLSLRDDTFEHSDVQQVLPVVYRSLTKPNKVGFSRALFQSIQERNILTSSGIYIGRRQTYDVDLARLDRVAQRIARGLFYHEQHRILPEQYEVFAFSAAGLSNITKDLKDQIITELVDPLLQQTPKTIGNNVFAYRCSFNPEDNNSSVWHFIFYDKVVFLCFTAPRDGAA